MKTENLLAILKNKYSKHVEADMKGFNNENG